MTKYEKKTCGILGRCIGRMTGLPRRRCCSAGNVLFWAEMEEGNTKVGSTWSWSKAVRQVEVRSWQHPKESEVSAAS